MSPIRCLSMVVSLVVLAGCGGGDDFGDLDAYLNEMRLRAPGKIEPTPTIRSYPTFTYNAANLRSPFSPQVRITRNCPLANPPCVAPAGDNAMVTRLGAVHWNIAVWLAVE